MIKDLFFQNKPVLSFEVFPPKRTDDIAIVYKTLDELKLLSPAFISVTYGAGGGTSKETVAIASYIKNLCGIESLAHLTCAALSEDGLGRFMEDLNREGIENVLALRGDRPKDMTEAEFESRRYAYAADLVTAIRKMREATIAGACYPERRSPLEMKHLKAKVEAGCDFLITQLFFDNQLFYDFMEHMDQCDIHVPVTAGLMPITATSQINTIIKLSGASVPAALASIFEKYRDSPDDFKRAGLDYATRQAMDLLEHGVGGVHLYTMNKVDVARTIIKNLR